VSRRREREREREKKKERGERIEKIGERECVCEEKARGE
jgi:hypothetical protein